MLNIIYITSHRLISVSRQLMEFAHTGRVDLMPRTIIGVICAADHYEFIGDIISIILTLSALSRARYVIIISVMASSDETLMSQMIPRVRCSECYNSSHSPQLHLLFVCIFNEHISHFNAGLIILM